MGKPVKISATDTGSTTEKAFTIYVDGKATEGTRYTVKKGLKLKVFDITVSSEQATWLRLYLSRDGGATWVLCEEVYLSSPGFAHVSYKMPWIVEALDVDILLEARYVQATAGRVSFSLNGEICRLEE